MSAGDGGLHGRPTAVELVEAVREHLETVLAPHVPEAQRYHLRVAAHLLAVVERELVLGPGQQEASTARLADLGLSDQTGLVEAIRTGRVRPDDPLVRAAVRADVRARLAVARPGYDE